MGFRNLVYKSQKISILYAPQSALSHPTKAFFVLQFAHQDSVTLSVKIGAMEIAILCTWYENQNMDSTFRLCI